MLWITGIIVVTISYALYAFNGVLLSLAYILFVYLFVGAMIASILPEPATTWTKIKMVFLWLPGLMFDRVYSIIE